MFPKVTEMTVDKVIVESNMVKNGNRLFAIYKGSDKIVADNIRTTYTMVGSGICKNKGKRIDIYKSPNENVILFGLSESNPERHFEVKTRAI